MTRARRGLVAALAGLAAGLAVLIPGLGDVLLSRGMAADAVRLPANATLPSAVLLPDARDSATATALAHRALAVAPLSSPALAWLARDAARRGDTAKAARLLAIVAQTGWRNEAAQRQLYNAAIAAGDAQGAARHADALLRQGAARADLFAAFDRGLARPGFRAALRPYLAASPGWPRDYLAGHGARLPDAALLDILAARAARQGGLPRAESAPLIIALLRAERLAAAAQTWQLTADGDGTGPGPLPWRRPAAQALATAFDWQIAPAYRPRDGSEEVLAVPALPGVPPVRRLVALPPGTYALDGAGQGAWVWSLACPGASLWPDLPLAPEARARVPAQCPVQVLAVAPAPDAPPGGPALGPVAIRRVHANER